MLKPILQHLQGLITTTNANNSFISVSSFKVYHFGIFLQIPPASEQWARHQNEVSHLVLKVLTIRKLDYVFPLVLNMMRYATGIWMCPSERQEEAGHCQFAPYSITQALLDWKIRDPNLVPNPVWYRNTNTQGLLYWLHHIDLIRVRLRKWTWTNLNYAAASFIRQIGGCGAPEFFPFT